MKRSLQVFCANQEEIDYYWEKLKAGGDPRAQQCGWLKDRFGLSWQVVPDFVGELFADEKSPRTERAMDAMLKNEKDRHRRAPPRLRRKVNRGDQG